MNVDTILLEIEKYGFDKLQKEVPSRDIKILKSLATIISGNKYITENQGKLLLKILVDNQDKILEVNNHIPTFLATPVWTNPFRKVDQTKRVFISKDDTGEPVLAVEFAFSASIRKTVGMLTKEMIGGLQSVNGRLFIAQLTEKNIVAVVEGLAEHNFEVHDTVKSHYDIIKSWKISEIKEKYTFDNLSEGALFNNLTSALGPLGEADKTLIRDMSWRYQYFMKNPENTEKTLKSMIVNRRETNVWVDSNSYELEDIIRELRSLNRLPMLVVFDSYSATQSIENLKKLEKSLEILGLENNVGIYFRLEKNEGEEFNKIIANKQYNKPLDSGTVIAGVTSGKLPKFFLKNEWKPMSVLSIGTRLKHSKTAVYASSCDLIIDYTPTPAIIETRNIWLQ